jgi:hypothetical protein
VAREEWRSRLIAVNATFTMIRLRFTTEDARLADAEVRPIRGAAGVEVWVGSASVTVMGDRTAGVDNRASL